ncbi:MAG: ribosome maturation factor RimM [Myxococcota bacterium]
MSPTPPVPPRPTETRRPDPDESWLDVGRVGRPHGVQGTVHVALFNPAGDFYEHTTTLRALVVGRPAFLVELLELRPVNDGFLARFEGFDDRAAAASLTHAVLSAARSALPDPEEDEVYLNEIVDSVVYDAVSGERIGQVSGLIATHTDLLEVRLDAGGKALLPVECDAIESLGREPGKVVVRDIEDWRSE